MLQNICEVLSQICRTPHYIWRIVKWCVYFDKVSKVLTSYIRQQPLTEVDEPHLKKKPSYPILTMTKLICPVRFFGLLTGLVFCQTIQLHQLTLSLHRSCIQRTGGQEHTAERGEGAGLPLLVAAHQSIDSAARWARPQLAPSSDGRYGKCVFGKVNRSMYSFQRAVYQHTWNFISAQMSPSLSKQMGDTTNGYSLQSLPCSSQTAWREDAVNAYHIQWPLYFVLWCFQFFLSVAPVYSTYIKCS